MTKDWLFKNAEFVLKVLGGSAVLIAIMGWPAVSLFFAGFGIPAEFVTMDAAIRAGILPALSFMVVFGYLWYVRWECNRRFQSKPREVLLDTPLFLLQVVPLAFVSKMVKIVGVFCGLFVALWSIANGIGAANELWGVLFWIVIFISLAGAIGLAAGYTVLSNKFRNFLFKDVTEGYPQLVMIYLRFTDYVELVKNFVALYLICLAVHVVVPGFIEQVSVLGLLVLAAFLSLAGALSVVGMAVIKRVKEISLGNLKGSTGFAVVATILVVMFYSVEIYPQLPKSLGGGEPAVIDVWLPKSSEPALKEWSQAQIHEEQIHLSDAYLVHLDKDVVILVEQPASPACWAVIPRSSVELLTAR